ncbi:MAG: toxin [Patescibacteria group bacterium]
MKRFEYSQEKNALVKKQHGISFEEVIDALESKKVLAAFPHPNHVKYPNQMMMVIEVKGYAYVVPTVEEEDFIFLKTAFPSRKYAKKYLKLRKEHI